MWGISATFIAVSAGKLKKDSDTSKIPLMGALGAFVFAAQMINFSIPGTGSSGHLGGALLLAILLGPYAALLVMVSILAVQALFFADGGILALGANIFNMGFYTCFLAYPLLYRPVAGDGTRRARVVTAALAASITGMTAGAFSVVIQTMLSGLTSLPFGPFTAMMLPIHFAIGIVEGIVTAVVVLTVQRVDPEISIPHPSPYSSRQQKKAVIIIIAAAVLIGGFFSWFASSHPDGLEWAIAGVSKGTELQTGDSGLIAASSWLQEKLSFLPGYGFRDRDGGNPATTVSGLIGGIFTLSVVSLLGVFLKKRARKSQSAKGAHAGN
jgi:cobalt/nickel transport system permease protein